MNQGLLLISPVVLVRLLAVDDFGRYREFLLYSGMLITLAGFGASSSLLHFVAQRPEHRQRFIDQVLLMTLVASAVIIGAVALINALLDGAVVGDDMLPVALYVALFVNFDFWEHLWLAQRRITAVFAYTTGRLIARMTVVITAAALTRDVTVVIWSLIGLESVRLLFAVIAWLRHRERTRAKLPGSWREQLRFCLPVGAASILSTLNKSMAGLFIAKMIGPVGLAHYAIGTYLRPVITVLRNSLSDVLLPEMSARERADERDPLHQWRRMTMLAAVLLTAAFVVLERFSHVLVTTIFTAAYEPAVLVFQIYLFVLLREIIDFAVPLRAINQTMPIMRSGLLTLVLNALLLAILLPMFGIAGAAMAYVVSRLVEGVYMALQMMRAYSIGPRHLARWSDLGKVALSALIASLTLYGSFWTDALGLFGVVIGGAIFMLVYAALLLALRVPEALALMQRIQQLPRAFSAKA